MHVSIEWLLDTYNNGRWLNANVVSLLIDSGLLILFAAQHTLMSSRNLKEFTWYTIGYEYEIYKPIYVTMTGVVLQVILDFDYGLEIIILTPNT